MRLLSVVLGVMLLVGYDLAGSVRVQTHSQYRWNENGLLIVTNGVLSQAKKDFQSLIVYIYGDWCLSAQGSVPKFVDLAHQHQVIDTKLVFGVLEVKDQKGLAKLGVKEVPSIIAFKAGTPHLITWNDNPDFDAIAHRLEIIYEDHFIQHFPDSHSLAEYRKNSSVVLFHGKKYSEPHRMTSLFWDFYKTAENHFSHHVTFGHMEPNNESGSQGMTSDSIYFCRTGGNPCLKYTREETNVFELYDWVNKLTDDPLIDIDGVGFDKVYLQQKTALIAFLKDDQNLNHLDKSALEALEAASSQIGGNILISRCFLSKPKCRELFHHLESNLSAESLPVVRMIVPIHDAHGAFATVKWNHGSVTEKAIIQYWRDSSSGRVEYDTKSESTGGVVHLENLHDADLRQVVTVTANNLRQTLKDRKARDLVLVLWQDGCPLSQKYLEMQKRLAAFLAGKTGSFLFASYNLIKNSKMGLKVGKVPAFRLYKVHYGIHFDEYDSDQGVDFDRILSFLLDYSSSVVEV